jgi:hypothetical protein
MLCCTRGFAPRTRYQSQMTETDHVAWRFFASSVRALIPNLIVDIGGTLAVFALLAPHFASSSIIPLLVASLVPLAGNVVSLVRHRRLDIVGIIVLVGLLAGVAGAAFGGTQRLLLIRESFATGAIGLACFISPVFPRPIAYYVVRHFMTAHEESHGLRFERLCESQLFRRTLRGFTFFWGVLLLAEFGLRVFMALTLPVVFVIAFGPLILNALMLLGGVVSAVWMGRSIHLALTSS